MELDTDDPNDPHDVSWGAILYLGAPWVMSAAVIAWMIWWLLT